MIESVRERERLIEAWIAHSQASQKARMVEQFARYLPESGWRALLRILSLPNARRHVSPIAEALSILISLYGDEFIERIEQQARTDAAFKACLAQVDPTPSFPLPEALWPRLSAAAGIKIGAMSEHMATLYAGLADLSQITTFDVDPLELNALDELSDAQLLHYAQDFLVCHDQFWAWEELERRVQEEGPEAAWPVLLGIVSRGSDEVLAALGAGPLEDLLDQYPLEALERVEQLAPQSQRFRFCLSHVWPGRLPPGIVDRVTAALGSEPSRG